MEDLRKIIIDFNINVAKISEKLDKITMPSVWIDIKTASAYSMLSVSTIRRAIVCGSLKCSRRSGKILLRHESIDRWQNG